LLEPDPNLKIYCKIKPEEGSDFVGTIGALPPTPSTALR
jgi:hypothetical protein